MLDGKLMFKITKKKQQCNKPCNSPTIYPYIKVGREVLKERTNYFTITTLHFQKRWQPA